MRGGHRRAGWEELMLWEGWRRDGHYGGGGGRAGFWGGDERGLVLGEQKGKTCHQGGMGEGWF